MFLYVFISCKTRIDKCYNRITSMMNKLNIDDYVIVNGGYEQDRYDQNTHILELKCNDFYEGLPEKMIMTFRFITSSQFFDKYTHICKLDDDMKIKQIFDSSMSTIKYGGDVQHGTGNRRWHVGRCTPGTYFNNKPYSGPYVPWAKGGYGYIISIENCKLVSVDENYEKEIYEDLYIAKILNKNGIVPVGIKDLKKYIHN